MCSYFTSAVFISFFFQRNRVPTGPYRVPNIFPKKKSW